jgi:hypothetical protein
MNTFSLQKCGDKLPKEILKSIKSGNILFLDFDGVCNSFKEGSYLTHEPDEYGPDMDIIERIKEICSLRHAKIIISSNWRRFEPDGYWVYNGKNYFNPLPNLCRILGDRIIGTLTTERFITKSEAIELWFEDHEDFHGKYAIVDDDPREGFQYNFKLMKNFWHTTPKYGLTEKIKEEIIDHLEED